LGALSPATGIEDARSVHCIIFLRICKKAWQTCMNCAGKWVSPAYLYGAGGRGGARRLDMARVRRSFFRNALDAIITARQRQADRYVREALLTFDDETLRTYGYNPYELRGRR